jgi:predicted CopG family antitoxin
MFKLTEGLMVHLVKTITIKDDVYEKLVELKRNDESFSDLFLRLAECQNPRQLLVKLRGTVDFTDKDRLLSEIYAKRAERRD